MDWQHVGSLQGPKGDPGSKIITGHGPPPDGMAIAHGDVYVDLDTGTMYTDESGQMETVTGHTVTYRGQWAPATTYKRGDILVYDGTSYLVTADFVSAATFDNTGLGVLAERGATGVAGPAGAVGPTGPAGAKGNTGSTGPAGRGVSSASITPDGFLILTFTDGGTQSVGKVVPAFIGGIKGRYDPTLSYNATDVVSYQGRLYQAKQALSEVDTSATSRSDALTSSTTTPTWLTTGTSTTATRTAAGTSLNSGGTQWREASLLSPIDTSITVTRSAWGGGAILFLGTPPTETAPVIDRYALNASRNVMWLQINGISWSLYIAGSTSPIFSGSHTLAAGASVTLRLQVTTAGRVTISETIGGATTVLVSNFDAKSTITYYAPDGTSTLLGRHGFAEPTDGGATGAVWSSFTSSAFTDAGISGYFNPLTLPAPAVSDQLLTSRVDGTMTWQDTGMVGSQQWAKFVNNGTLNVLSAGDYTTATQVFTVPTGRVWYITDTYVFNSGSASPTVNFLGTNGAVLDTAASLAPGTYKSLGGGHLLTAGQSVQLTGLASNLSYRVVGYSWSTKAFPFTVYQSVGSGGSGSLQPKISGYHLNLVAASAYVTNASSGTSGYLQMNSGLMGSFGLRTPVPAVNTRASLTYLSPSAPGESWFFNSLGYGVNYALYGVEIPPSA